MKVVITNTVLLNGGDAAILIAIMRHVRSVFGEDTEIVVADTQPELASAYYPEFEIITPLYVHAFPPRREVRFQKVHGAMRFARWYSSLPRLYAAAFALGNGRVRSARLLTTRGEWETLRHYADADVIVSTGGTYLVENYWLAPRVFDFRIALLLGKPLVLYTQSMGPFETPYARRTLRGIFRNAALILLRDEASLQHVHDLCQPSEVNARLAADAVFSLADPAVLARSGPLQLPERGFKVGMSVRRWPFFKTMSEAEGMEAYKTAVAGAVEALVRRHDASITFVSTCQGAAGYAYDDSEVARAIVDRLPSDVADRVAVDSGFHRPEELIRMLSDFDLIVATRMHMAILGLAAGVPVLPIAYEFKTQALFDRLGIGDLVCDIEAVSGGRLADMLALFVAELPAFREELFTKVEEERRRADSAAECLEFVWHTRGDGGTGSGERRDDGTGSGEGDGGTRSAEGRDAGARSEEGREGSTDSDESQQNGNLAPSA